MKKTVKKKMWFLCLFVMLVLAISLPASAAGKANAGRWVSAGSAKYFVQTNGKKATGSYAVKGVYYVFDKDGKLVTPRKIHL